MHLLKDRWLVSVILFVTCAHLRASPIIDVAGSVDGSGVMQVNNGSVSWTNAFFNTPTALVVNGAAWNPSVSPSINIPGLLLPNALSDYSVSTDVLAGRDVAVAQVANGHVLIYFADTPNGADNYHVQVSLTPRPNAAPSPPASLHIVGTIDGSDTLEIRAGSLTWVHDQWSQPSGMTVNGTAWNTVSNPTLPDSGATAFLPVGVDLSSVVFTKNLGRDTATYQLFSDKIYVYFGDNPGGASTYDVSLSFGLVPEPGGLAILAGTIPCLTLRRRIRRCSPRQC